MLSSIALIMLSDQPRQNLTCSQVHQLSFSSQEVIVPVDHTNQWQDQVLIPKSWFHCGQWQNPYWPSMGQDVVINIQSFELSGNRIRSFYACCSLCWCSSTTGFAADLPLRPSRYKWIQPCLSAKCRN